MQLRNAISIRASILWLALNLADLALTLVIVQRGVGYEGNPLLQLLPIPGMIAFKMGMALLVIAVVGTKFNIMYWINVGMALVVMWNLGCLIAGLLKI